jgi:hypothetical protein
MMCAQRAEDAFASATRGQRPVIRVPPGRIISSRRAVSEPRILQAQRSECLPVDSLLAPNVETSEGSLSMLSQPLTPLFCCS